MGGVLVDPAHNLKYVEGAAAGPRSFRCRSTASSRAFHLELTPYLTAYGQELLEEDQHKSITNEVSTPGLTWSRVVKPEYPTPETIPVFVSTANKLNRQYRHADRALPDRPGQRR